MTYLVTLICLLCLTILHGAQEKLEPKNGAAIFRKFKDDFHKQYSSKTERKKRYLLFKQQLEKNVRHNKKNHHHPQYYMEINKFSDLDETELHRYLGLGNVTELFSDLQEDVQQLELRDHMSVPDHVDHVADGLVTPVKNQLACGSCWIFAGVGSFEGAYKQATGYLKSFSEQEALDCSYPDTRDGCRGGWYNAIYKYLMLQQRLASYNDLPYLGSDRTCIPADLPANAIKNLRFTGYKRVSTDVTSIQAALSKRVLAVALYASTMFPYRSGIFNGCPQYYFNEPNHAMLLTGYTPLAWTLKNSWGEDWGENGYIRISRNTPQDGCLVIRDAYYPSVQYEDKRELDQEDLYQEPEDRYFNFAQGGLTNQSSTSWLGDSYRAVDGNTGNDFYEGSCSRTKVGNKHEWNVKLNKTLKIKKVVITLRSDCGICLKDIDGATVRVGDHGNYRDTQCGDRLKSANLVDYTLTVNCILTGKFVSVQMDSSERRELTLCEVEVFGEKVGSDCAVPGNVKCSDGLCKPPSFC